MTIEPFDRPVLLAEDRPVGFEKFLAITEQIGLYWRVTSAPPR